MRTNHNISDVLLITKTNPASGGAYAAIAALTNIPAILVGACLYELCLADSMRGIQKALILFYEI